MGSQVAIQELVDIAAKYDAEPVHVALSWLINNQGESVVAILGTSRVEHVHEGIRVMMISLTAEKTARMDEITYKIREQQTHRSTENRKHSEYLERASEWKRGQEINISNHETDAETCLLS